MNYTRKKNLAYIVDPNRQRYAELFPLFDLVLVECILLILLVLIYIQQLAVVVVVVVVVVFVDGLQLITHNTRQNKQYLVY